MPTSKLKVTQFPVKTQNQIERVISKPTVPILSLKEIVVKIIDINILEKLDSIDIVNATVDVFVPLDTAFFSGLLSEIAYSGVIRDFCFNYLDGHRKELMKMKDSDEFIEKFVVTDAMISSLIVMAEKEEVKVNKGVVKKITPQLKTRIKSQLARNLYDETAMYRVLLETDPDFKKAMQVLGNLPEYAALIRK